MKALAKTFLRRTAKALPWGVRAALLEGFLDSFGRYTIFQRLGAEYHTRNILVDGEYGQIEGALCDEGVLRFYATHGSFATRSNRLVIDFFKHHGGGTYIDIGANIGLTTIPVAQNPNVYCICFEPEPRTYGFLQANILRNCHSQNVCSYNVALFDRKAKLRLELAEANLGDHRVHLYDESGWYGEQNRAIVSVDAERLDALIDRATIESPIVVKADTQGSESFVFTGGRGVIGDAALIIFEYWPYGLRRLRGDAGFLADFVMTHFDSGAVAKGESTEELVWHPTKEIGAMMQALNGTEASAYYDIIARKDALGFPKSPRELSSTLRAEGALDQPIRFGSGGGTTGSIEPPLPRRRE